MPLKPIAYVQASWHTDITELAEACVSIIERLSAVEALT